MRTTLILAAVTLFALAQVVVATTIVGIKCLDGVVLGADSRSTGGPLIMDKNKEKVHALAQYIYCCGAGTSADCEQISRRAKHLNFLLDVERDLDDVSNIANFNNPILYSVKSIAKMIKEGINNRKPEAVFIMGGIDNNDHALYQINMDGSYIKVNYASLGSGSIDAMAILESSLGALNGNITVDRAVEIIRQSVKAGIMNDLGSGSHIDICAIKSCEVKRWRELSIDIVENTLRQVPHDITDASKIIEPEDDNTITNTSKIIRNSSFIIEIL